APNIESKKDKSTTNSLKRKDVEGPSLDGGSEHEEPLDVDNYDSDASENENNDSDSSSEMSSTSRLMREVDVRGVDSVHVDSFEEDIKDCRVRPVKAAVKDSSIESPSTPSVTDLNLAEESCSTWLDYVGPLITNELDFEKRWNYRDPDGNVEGPFSLAQLRMWKDYFPSDLKIWSYYGTVKKIFSYTVP
nr:zinc finger CCCH domain-containing protein 19 [Tanacetum cinerariifolium]